MELNGRVWLGFWALATLAFLGVVFAIWDSYNRDRAFDASAPIVETCVPHNVRQQVVIK